MTSVQEYAAKLRSLWQVPGAGSCPHRGDSVCDACCEFEAKSAVEYLRLAPWSEMARRGVMP